MKSKRIARRHHANWAGLAAIATSEYIRKNCTRKIIEHTCSDPICSHLFKVDRRRFSRFTTTLPVEIRGVNNKTLKATVIEISQAGMQIKCNTGTARSIVPDDVAVTPSQNVMVTSMLGLPKPKQKKQTTDKITIQCKIIFVLRYSQDDYIIGFQFLSIDQKAEEKLLAYLDELIKNRGQ